MPGGVDAGDYVFTYDANGNVAQVLDLSAGSAAAAIVAHYEYDPYGGVVNDLSGYTYAEANPIRFSTKYWDAETGLGYWGYRYYSARLGRWLSRDPLEEAGGAHLYAYVFNQPTVSHDALGLWGHDVHYWKTFNWAWELGMHPIAASHVGRENSGTDGLGSTGWLPLIGDQGRHFDRSRGGVDSRLQFKALELQRAIWYCSKPPEHWTDPHDAARHLGRALHSVQDWWAHGDFSKGPRDVIGSASTLVSHGPGYDTWGLDAVGTQAGVAALPGGRPPQVFVWVSPSFGVVVKQEHSWKNWQAGDDRKKGTEGDSKQIIRQFLDVVRGGSHCYCVSYFLGCEEWRNRSR